MLYLRLCQKIFVYIYSLKNSNVNGFPFDVGYLLAYSIWDSSYWDQAGSQGRFRLV